MSLFSRALEYLLDDDQSEDNIDALRDLLDDNPDLIDQQEEGSDKTLLHYACEEGLTEIAEMLLYEFNADPLLASYNDDELADALPIHYAAYADHADCLSLLLRHPRVREMINEKDGLGLTPLLEAIVNSSTQVLSLLFQHQACKVNEEVGSGDVGADRAVVDIPDETTPLCALILMGNEEGALELLNARDEVDILDGFPLHRAAKCGMSKLVEKLLEIGADLNFKDDTGIPELLEIGADLNFKDDTGIPGPCYEILSDEKGRPALYYAVKKGHLEVVQVFYRYAKNHDRYMGENFREGDERISLLHLAVENGSTRIAHYLMWFPRIDFNVIDASGLTAFDLAVRDEHTQEVAHFKHRFNADPNRRLPSISRSRKKSKLHAVLSRDIDPFSATLLLGDESEELGSELTEFILSQAPKESEDADDNKLLIAVAAQRSDPTLEAYLGHPALKSITIEAALEEDQKDIAPEYQEKIRKKAAAITKDEAHISDASDSSDDDFSPEPSKTLIPAAIQRQGIRAQRLVANYRGEQYGQGKEKKNERQKKRDRDPSLYGLHSSASVDLLEKKFKEEELPKDADDETKLNLYDKRVNQDMRKMQKTAYSGKDNKKAKTDSDADFQSYIHRYDAHLDEFAGAEGDAENMERLKRYQFPFTKNPNLSFSDTSKVALKFGTGLNSASDRTVNKIKVRSNGAVHNPYIGEVFVVLHTPDQLRDNGSEHAPTLLNQQRIGIKHMYRFAYERRFQGGIPNESCLKKIVIKIPSFDEYLPHYQEKYGLTEEKFQYYQKKLTKASNQEEVDAVIKNFLGFLLKYLEPQIEQFANDTANLEQAEIVYDDWEGGFSTDRYTY